jgi:ankyrin repeat protein
MKNSLLPILCFFAISCDAWAHNGREILLPKRGDPKIRFRSLSTFSEEELIKKALLKEKEKAENERIKLDQEKKETNTAFEKFKNENKKQLEDSQQPLKGAQQEFKEEKKVLELDQRTQKLLNILLNHGLKYEEIQQFLAFIHTNSLSIKALKQLLISIESLNQLKKDQKIDYWPCFVALVRNLIANQEKIEPLNAKLNQLIEKLAQTHTCDEAELSLPDVEDKLRILKTCIILNWGVFPEVMNLDPAKNSQSSGWSIGSLNKFIGWDLYNQTITTLSPLHLAILLNRPELVKAILNKTQNQWLEKPDINGLTPFLLAAALNNHTLMIILHDAGANINAINMEGQTALMQAAKAINFGQIIMLTNWEAKLDAQDTTGNTALHYAVLARSIAKESSSKKEAKETLLLLHLVIEKFRRAGTNPNLQNKTGDTPLHIAVATRTQSITERLLTFENIDLEIKNNKGQTPSEILVQTLNTAIAARTNAQFKLQMQQS